jgi:hypothetical protein
MKSGDVSESGSSSKSANWSPDENLNTRASTNFGDEGRVNDALANGTTSVPEPSQERVTPSSETSVMNPDVLGLNMVLTRNSAILKELVFQRFNMANASSEDKGEASDSIIELSLDQMLIEIYLERYKS